MENKTVEELLESLAALAGDARGSLFGQDKVMVDREELLYLVDSLQNQLPVELSEARTIIENSNALRNNAKMDAAETRKAANQVLKDAEERAANLIEEDNIVTFAKMREQEIMEEAEQQRALLIAGAVQYADQIMEEAQQTISNALESLKSGFVTLQEQAKTQFDGSQRELSEARQALKNAKDNQTAK